MKSDVLIGGLLVVAWTCSSFGTAQQNWPLVWAAIPSLTLALVLQITAMTRRNKAGQHAIDQMKADADPTLRGVR